MAGHDDTQGVATNRGTHGAHGFGATDLPTDEAVAASQAVGDATQGLPHVILKGGAAAQIERQVKLFELAGKIGVELASRLPKQGVVRAGPAGAQIRTMGFVAEPGAHQRGVGGGQHHGAKRADVGCLNGKCWNFHIFWPPAPIQYVLVDINCGAFSLLL
jgi:hypothetical protein